MSAGGGCPSLFPHTGDGYLQGFLTGLWSVPSGSAIHPLAWRIPPHRIVCRDWEHCLHGFRAKEATRAEEWKNKLSWASSLRSKNHGVLGTPSPQCLPLLHLCVNRRLLQGMCWGGEKSGRLSSHIVQWVKQEEACCLSVGLSPAGSSQLCWSSLEELGLDIQEDDVTANTSMHKHRQPVAYPYLFSWENQFSPSLNWWEKNTNWPLKLTTGIALRGVKRQLQGGLVITVLMQSGAEQSWAWTSPMVFSFRRTFLISHAARRTLLRFDYNSDFRGCTPAFSTCFAARGCLSLLCELVNASLTVWMY